MAKGFTVKASAPVTNKPADEFSMEKAKEMIDRYGVDGIMIGRAAIGNPWIFTHVLARLDGEAEPETDLENRFEIMNRYVQESVKYFGEEIACRMMRSVRSSHLRVRNLRREINGIHTAIARLSPRYCVPNAPHRQECRTPHRRQAGKSPR